MPAAWGTRPLQKPVGDVIADLRQMNARRAIFLDLNLIADLSYARELFTALIPLKLRWAGLATTTIAWDEELLDLAARSGCRGLLIGFESLDQKSLDETRKSFNMRKDYRLVIDRIHDRGIAIMGCFVFGFDHDTLETFDRTVDFVDGITPGPASIRHRGSVSCDRPLPAPESGEPPLDRGLVTLRRPARRFQPGTCRPTSCCTTPGAHGRRRISYRSIARRVLGSGTRMAISVGANLGYRFYANNLDRFYTCDWQLAPRA